MDPPAGSATALAAAGTLLLAACSSGSSTAQPDSGGKYGVIYEDTGTGPMVDPTIPTTPSVANYFGEISCDGERPPPTASSRCPTTAPAPST